MYRVINVGLPRQSLSERSSHELVPRAGRVEYVLGIDLSFEEKGKLACALDHIERLPQTAGRDADPSRAGRLGRELVCPSGVAPTSRCSLPFNVFPTAAMNAIASSSRSPLLSPCLVPPRLFAPSVLSSTSMRPFSSSSARSAANASQNHYRTLDLDRGATKKQIKEKFYEVSYTQYSRLGS